MTTSTATFLPAYVLNAVADGYCYECSCGELYNSVAAAYSCRKCRNYSVFGYCTHVVDVRTEEVVAGAKPSVEEYEEALEHAEVEWEAMATADELRRQMDAQEGELYRQEMKYRADHDAMVAAELELDIAYGIQDELMGVWR